MTAETLRRAAALMRERAEAASAAPWTVSVEHGRDYTDEAWYSTDVTAADGKSAAWYCDEQEGVESAYHIASWHPDVALAVAAWLDTVADANEPPDDSRKTHKGRTICHVDEDAALTVARAYLGDQS